MIYVASDNIFSPFAKTTEGNYDTLKHGMSTTLCPYTPHQGIAEPYYASRFHSSAAWEGVFEPTYWEKINQPTQLSPFEATIAASISIAIQDIPEVIDANTVLIISTTKGNVGNMHDNEESTDNFLPGKSAQRIADIFGIKATPIVVCNACISGLSAIILAQRLLETGTYEHAIVCGADHVGAFIISGFQSLKALSHTACRPFDMERNGLNLGEAAATLVLSSKPTEKTRWAIKRGSIHNDAYHVTAPSKEAEGLYRCMKDVLQGEDKDDLAVINLHGTATLFNDQMESIALQRMGLSDVPANALKSYYGHTMGAAGILETIITMHAIDDHTILGTRNFDELGVSGKVNISAQHRRTDKQDFMKVLSGFGGANAAILMTKKYSIEPERLQLPHCKTTHTVLISPTSVTVDGRNIEVEGEGSSLLTHIYKRYIANYPKFYKMDGLSKLGFVASELLLQAERNKAVESLAPQCSTEETRAIIFFNQSSSIHSDRQYLASIADENNYFPSPSVFIYTLPNIVTGEIAIRNHYHGETSFFILPERDEDLETSILKATLARNYAQSAITGWLDYEDDTHFLAHLYLVEQE